MIKAEIQKSVYSHCYPLLALTVVVDGKKLKELGSLAMHEDYAKYIVAALEKEQHPLITIKTSESLSVVDKEAYEKLKKEYNELQCLIISTKNDLRFLYQNKQDRAVSYNLLCDRMNASGLF